jgi:hypothetical protein
VIGKRLEKSMLSATLSTVPKYNHLDVCYIPSSKGKRVLLAVAIEASRLEDSASTELFPNVEKFISSF